MRRKCASRVMDANGEERPCKLSSQTGSKFCHQHLPAKRSNTSETKPQINIAQDSFVSGYYTQATESAGGCVKQIGSLVADSATWTSIISVLENRFDSTDDLAEIIHKDLYVTEAIRCAVQPSEVQPQALVVFKGGTSLAKAYPILKRFSEDVDVNIIPQAGQQFGDSRRKKVRRELNSRLAEGIPLQIKQHRRGSNYATYTIRYPQPTDPQNEFEVGWDDTSNITVHTSAERASVLSYGSVLVEMNIRRQPPNTTSICAVSSLAGEAATIIDPTILREYPLLQPFKVLTADPIIAVVDKLDALHWRSASDHPERVCDRTRDIYDLACLLRYEPLVERLDSDVVAEMHELVLEFTPPGLIGRVTARPVGGFAHSPAFDPRQPAYQYLRNDYPKLQSTVYTDNDWIEFDDALAIIRSRGDLL